MAFGFLRAGFEKIKAGLKKTADKLVSGINTVISVAVGRKLTEEDCSRLEELLIQNDFGPRLTFELVEKVRSAYLAREVKKVSEVTDFLREQLKASLFAEPAGPKFAETGPTVILVVGVNGTGKTTTIAKLARRFTEEGRSVLLAAGDTFRAAAIDQLKIWAERTQVEIVAGKPNADAASIAYQGLDAARARGKDVLIIDTAGRLHTKENLMKELEKMLRVLRKLDPNAPHEVLLVLDATTGQNAIQQARVFTEGVGVTGLVLTKLDGTAKGGVVLAIRRDVGLPVKWIGVGEQMDDLQPFEADAFLRGLLPPQDEAPAAP